MHDYLTQRGGAERVVLAMLRAFPAATLYTSVYSPETTFSEFSDRKVSTTWLDRVPAFRRDPRRAFPLLASAFERLIVHDAEVAICSSSGWAHGIADTCARIVYCHNPARWLYQPDHYLDTWPAPLRSAFRGTTRPLRAWDRSRALTANYYLANSRNVRDRIYRNYGIEAEVLHPPVALTADGPRDPVPGIEPGYLLTVGRPRGYKHHDVVANAIERLPGERLVMVGGDPALARASSRITAVSGVSDAQLRWLYANATALVAVSYEDFGLTPVEAFQFGTPVLALAWGGYLETCEGGVTGYLIAEPSAEAIIEAIRRLRSDGVDTSRVRAASEPYSFERFAARLQELAAEISGSRMSVAPRSAAWVRARPGAGAGVTSGGAVRPAAVTEPDCSPA